MHSVPRPADGSEMDPIRSAQEKIRRIKKVVADSRSKANRIQGEEVQSRIRAKIREQKIASARSKQQQQSSESDTAMAMATAIPRVSLTHTAPSIMAALSEDIETMEREAQALLEELECAKRESKSKSMSKSKFRSKRKQAKEGIDEEFLAGRITSLEVENKILKTRLQSGQATVDSIRADISNTVSSNQDCKKALKKAKAASITLQAEQEDLRKKLEQAETDLKSLENEASRKRAARSLEMDQKELFEQATRDILELQRNYCLRRQQSQRKLLVQQQRQQKQLQKKQQHQHQEQEIEMQPRSLRRQNSWWQLGTPEKAPKKLVRVPDYVKMMEPIGRSTSEDSDIDSSYGETFSLSSGSLQ